MWARPRARKIVNSTRTGLSAGWRRLVVGVRENWNWRRWWRAIIVGRCRVRGESLCNCWNWRIGRSPWSWLAFCVWLTRWTCAMAETAQTLRGSKSACRTASWWCGWRDTLRWTVRRKILPRRDICWRRCCGGRCWCGGYGVRREAKGRCGAQSRRDSRGRLSRRDPWLTLLRNASLFHTSFVTHAKLVSMAVRWLRRYRCGVVLSEQACASGEMPDAIGWKRACHSVLVESKVSRADFLADRDKPFRQTPETGVGCERYYLALRGLIRIEELPAGWGLLEVYGREIERVKASAKNLRSEAGFQNEMNLLLASLRRVEIRIEPESITDFLKWKNRMVEYNRGQLPEGLVAREEEANGFLMTTIGE